MKKNAAELDKHINMSKCRRNTLMEHRHTQTFPPACTAADAGDLHNYAASLEEQINLLTPHRNAFTLIADTPAVEVEHTAPPAEVMTESAELKERIIYCTNIKKELKEKGLNIL
jgi:hypothetical protein